MADAEELQRRPERLFPAVEGKGLRLARNSATRCQSCLSLIESNGRSKPLRDRLCRLKSRRLLFVRAWLRYGKVRLWEGNHPTVAAPKFSAERQAPLALGSLEQLRSSGGEWGRLRWQSAASGSDETDNRTVFGRRHGQLFVLAI
jgi:hypothetical protein